MVDTKVVGIPFVLIFLDNFKINKKGLHIRGIAIIIFHRIQSMIPNVRIIQTNNISCG